LSPCLFHENAPKNPGDISHLPRFTFSNSNHIIDHQIQPGKLRGEDFLSKLNPALKDPGVGRPLEIPFWQYYSAFSILLFKARSSRYISSSALF
jgi:hypothetical protein